MNEMRKIMEAIEHINEGDAVEVSHRFGFDDDKAEMYVHMEDKLLAYFAKTADFFDTHTATDTEGVEYLLERIQHQLRAGKYKL